MTAAAAGFETYARCRACQAAIRWARTPQGKAIPMDPEPAIDGNMELKPPDPRWPDAPLALHVNPTSPPEDLRYKTHFATCPAARRFSKAEMERARRRTEERVRRGL